MPSHLPTATTAAKKASVAQAERAALRYWHARKPDADCDDRPVDVKAISSRSIDGQLMEAGPIGECGRPFVENPDGQSPPYVLVAKSVRARGWLVFCTTVIQGWGLITGELFDKKHPGDVMYPVVTKKSIQQRACRATGGPVPVEPTPPAPPPA